ncbi:LOW QUALITY PROTEIN: hypothetical protein TorRG33x02_005280, partial [Trema orientale]
DVAFYIIVEGFYHHLVDLADTWPCNNFHVASNLDGYDFTPERRILKGRVKAV